MFLFFSLIFQFINESIYGFNYFENIFDDVKIFHNSGHEYFSKHILIHLFFSYIGVIFFTVSLYINEAKKRGIEREGERENKIYSVSLLLNNHNKNINQKFWILLIAFLWIVEDILFIFYTLILGGLDSLFLELLIVIYLSKKWLGTNIFKHQKFALLINIFPLISKYIFIILSVKLENNSNLIYIRHIWVIPLGILIYLILAIIRSFVNVRIKTMIDFKFTTQNKIIITYGIMGVIITSILWIFTSIFNCKLGEIQNYLCNVSENNNSHKYIDSLPIYYNILKGYFNEDSIQIMFEIFVIILGGITFLLNKYFFLMAIKGLNPVLVIYSFPILFLLRKIALIINTLIISKSFYVRDVTGLKKLKFIFDMIGDFLSFISFLIYSELIELHFDIFQEFKPHIIVPRSSKDINEITEKYDDEDDDEYLID